jgi:hypothetical protein
MHLLSHESFCKWGCNESNDSFGYKNAAFVAGWAVAHSMLGSSTMRLMSNDSTYYKETKFVTSE